MKDKDKSRKSIPSKKGMFFSIMITAVVILFIFNYINEQNKSNKVSTESISARIDSMNKFVKDTTSDLNRATYIAGYRAILGINEHITTTGEFARRGQISEAVINGTIDGNYINITSRDNLNDWKSSITLLGKELYINTTIEFKDIEIYQENPWEITFKTKVHFRFYDLMNTSYFDLNSTGYSRISIINFEDPSYSVMTNGTSINVVNKSKYSLDELRYDGTADRKNRLKDIIINQNYVADYLAPSYIGRLTGNMSPDKNGIESFMNINHLQEGFMYNTTDVDYLYFKRNVPSKKIDISGLDWFRLDDEHIEVYNLTDLIS